MTFAVLGCPGVFPLFLVDAPFFQFGRVNKQLQLRLVDINEDTVARLNQSDQATRRGLGRDVTDRDP